MRASASEVIIRAEVCAAQREAEADHPPYPVPEPGGAGAAEGGPGGGTTQPGGRATEVPPAHSHVYRQLRLQFSVPKGKVSGLMGVMNLLQHRFERLEISLAARDGAISDQEYENSIKETFRQLGIEFREE